MSAKLNRMGIIFGVGIILAWAAIAPAATVDLTGGAGSSGSLSGGLFAFQVEQPAGTGVLESFVRIQGRSSEQGYNTSGRAVAFDEKKDPNFTRDLTFGQVPIVEVNGVQYLEFLLDINEPKNRSKSQISLDMLQIYTSSTGSQTTTDISSLGVLRYDLDSGGDSNVLLDSRAATGSGKTDMQMLIPLANFAGVVQGDFLYLYSKFSGAQGGFEEWAIREGATPPPGPGPTPGPTIPLPGAGIMGLALLTGIAGWRRHHRLV